MDINFIRKHEFTLFHGASDLVRAEDDVPLIPPPDFRSQILFDESHQETSSRIASTSSYSLNKTNHEENTLRFDPLERQDSNTLRFDPDLREFEGRLQFEREPRDYRNSMNRNDEVRDENERYNNDYDEEDRDEHDRDHDDDHEEEDRDQKDWDQDDRNDDDANIATNYEIDLAARAYANLFSERRFSLDELKPAALDRALTAYKLETAEQRERDLEIYTDQTEYDKLDDYYAQTYIKGVETDRDGAPEDNAWSKLFANRPFDLDELRPGVRWQAMSEWRDEVLRLNKEDHDISRQNHDVVKPQDCEHEQSAKDSDLPQWPPPNYSATRVEESGAFDFSKPVDIKLELELLSERDPKRASELKSYLQEYEVTKEWLDKRFPQFADESRGKADSIDKLLFGENASIHSAQHNKTQAEIQIEGWQRDAFNPALINLQNERCTSIFESLAENLQRNPNGLDTDRSPIAQEHEREDNEGERNR